MKKRLHQVLALMVIPMLLGASTYWVKTEHVCLKAVQKKEVSSCCQKFHQAKTHHRQSRKHDSGHCLDEKCCIVTVTAISPSVQDFTNGGGFSKLESIAQLCFPSIAVSDRVERILHAKLVQQPTIGHSPPFLKAYNRQLLTLHNVLRC